MGFLGYSRAELDAAYERGRREGRSSATDNVGRDTRTVWWLSAYHVMLRGGRPPMLCPDDIVDDVRAALERQKPVV